MELPQGSPLTAVDAEVRKVENVLQGDSQVDSYSSTFGSSFTPQADDVFDQGGGYIQQPNVANLSVSLKNKKDVNAFINRMQPAMSSLSQKASITVSNQNIAGDDSQIKIMLTGADSTTLENAAQLVRSKLAGIDGLSVAGKTDLTNGIPKYAVTIDRKKVLDAGVEPADINKILARYMAKGKDFEVPASHGVIPVDVYLDSVQSGAGGSQTLPVYAPDDVLKSLAGATVTGTGGAAYRFDQLASIRKSSAESTIQERDGEPFAVVTSQIVSSDVSNVSKKVNDTLKGISLPDGVSYSMGGITQQVTEMIVEMAVAIIVSILLVLLITGFVFKGWRAPFAVLASIPLALSGIVLALYAIQGQWNLAALIGVLMLTGIVVTNGIVLIDKIERNRKEGLGLRDAVLQGSLSRVRPIFMTAGTTILTLLPLALSHSADTVISQVLGIVVIGGMITSTLNSFVVIPILYEWMQRKQAKTEIHLSA
ncbi:efflux RND transporter permease subunit [Cohnella candidum]|uniref:efflux RND transporter permease subunit n=1 Tax=Cohnella candidum TaxID=2674991 RepID=UPI0024076F12|nr:efflux RND transporter permease subunit [Cohnella candidum]